LGQGAARLVAGGCEAVGTVVHGVVRGVAPGAGSRAGFRLCL